MIQFDNLGSNDEEEDDDDEIDDNEMLSVLLC